MRVAIFIFGTSISPRFDYAPEALIVDIEEGHEVKRESIALGGLHPVARLNGLKDKHVDVLICGNIDVNSEQMTESMGIRLIPWVTGEADKAIRLFLAGELAPGTILSPSGTSVRWGLGWGRGMCRQGRWFKEFNRSQEDETMPKRDGTGPAGKGPGAGRGLGPCGSNKGAGKGEVGSRDMGGKSGKGRGRGQAGGGGRGGKQGGLR